MTALARDRWSLTYDLVEGGIVLGELRHDGFSLAKDVRVTRIWVGTDFPSRGGTLVDFKLGSAALPATTAVTVLPVVQPPPTSGTPRGMDAPSTFFNQYRNLFGLQALYKSKDPLLKAMPNECTLEIEQRHLFSEYGKNPPHEPGAVLDAARLFPLLRFALPAVKDKKQPCPRYFRVDFRVDVALDNIEEKAMSAVPAAGGDNIRNKAAIFRDIEADPNPIEKTSIALQIVSGLFAAMSGPSARGLFAALEKPLKYEVAMRGLVEGDAPGWSRLDTWDNVHVWAAKRGEGEESISTPGAFHALHCHWRWGAVTGDPDANTSILPAAGQPQFTGLGWTKVRGGPLIAYELPRQNISVAVTRNDAPAWRKEDNPSTREFISLFTDVRGVPDVIEKGDDLVLWFSFELFRDDDQLDKPWGGTLFVNGMYFAHNKDATPNLLRVAGAYGEASNPTPKRAWVRKAR